VKDLKIQGEHNLANLFAAATCSYLIGIIENNISNTMKSFQGVEHRLESVKFVNDVEFINDSKATNIQSVQVAIQSYDKPIILILGGYNKGADFRLLLPHIKSSNVRDIVSYGDAGGQINTALGDAVSSVQVTDLSSAVKIAHNLATPGDIVLLSPGCASFDQFENFEARGNFYKSVVKNEL
jgi:UDP-N-acetylmuramoylalanine--D-glutamate ligase